MGFLCLILTACAGPVGATRTDPWAVLRDLGRSAITTSEPTWQTRNVLLEQGLLAAFEDRPEEVLAELHRALVSHDGHDPTGYWFFSGRAAVS